MFRSGAGSSPNWCQCNQLDHKEWSIELRVVECAFIMVVRHILWCVFLEAWLDFCPRYGPR